MHSISNLTKNPLNIAVLGGGSWGTALAHLLSTKGHYTTLIMRNEEVALSINTQHKNPKYLKDKYLHHSLIASTDLSLIKNSELLVLAIPCQQLYSYLSSIKPYISPNAIVINTAKGLDLKSHETMNYVVSKSLIDLNPKYAILSGPSFAAEVMEHQPTAVVLGCACENTGDVLREIFSTSWFRCYSSLDVKGVELGGAMKNVMAIAAGVCDGLGLGHNSRAALICRGLAEMTRLGISMGAQEHTFIGLSGLGDLTLTCNGNLSRNRQVGLRLGQGEKLQDIVNSLGMVAEGVKTAEVLHQIAIKKQLCAPITESVCNLVMGQIKAREAVENLMSRDLKKE